MGSGAIAGIIICSIFTVLCCGITVYTSCFSSNQPVSQNIELGANDHGTGGGGSIT
jgi:hypothetical protein